MIEPRWKEDLYEAIKSATDSGITPAVFVGEIESMWQDARIEQRKLDEYHFRKLAKTRG